MTKITILTKNSAIALFLVANVFTSLYAIPITTKVRIENKKQNISLSQDIEEVLIDKGLDINVAKERVTALFSEKININKLNALYTNKVLGVSKSKLNSKIAELALFKKYLELDSYESLYTLVQSTKRVALNKKQKEELRVIATS